MRLTSGWLTAQRRAISRSVDGEARVLGFPRPRARDRAPGPRWCPIPARACTGAQRREGADRVGHRRLDPGQGAAAAPTSRRVDGHGGIGAAPDSEVLTRELSVRQQRLQQLRPRLRPPRQLSHQPYRLLPSNQRRLRSKVRLLWSNPWWPRDARYRPRMNSWLIRLRRCHRSRYRRVRPAPKLMREPIGRAWRLRVPS